jgi:hypothetical protein
MYNLSQRFKLCLLVVAFLLAGLFSLWLYNKQ